MRRDVSASSASGFTQCRACSVVTGWYPIKRAQRGGKPRTPLPLFVSQCKPRRLCKCCSWKRNRCLSPIPALSRPSPSPSGYAYILIPIASFQPRRFAGYCLDPPAKFLRNSGEREAAPPPPPSPRLLTPRGCELKGKRSKLSTVRMYARRRRARPAKLAETWLRILDRSWFAA